MKKYPKHSKVFKIKGGIRETLESLMVQHVVSLDPSATLAEAAAKLSEHKIGALVILDKGRLAGILSERDFVTRVAAGGLNLQKTRVSQVMTRRVFTVTPRHTVQGVLRLMQRYHIRHIPVMSRTEQVIGIVSMRDLLMHLQNRLESLVSEQREDLSLDALTGLYSPRFFQSYLDAEIARSLRRGYRFCLLFIDLDHFKVFNDAGGHGRGDQILRDFSGLLHPQNGKEKPEFSIRRSDIAFRLGGDEFVLILPETHRAGAKVCAERLRKSVQKKFASVDGRKKLPPMTVSIGIAEFPSDSTRKDDLVHKADQALYNAKRAGRNRVMICSS